MSESEELTDQILYFFNNLTSWENSIVKASDLTLSEAHAIEVLGQYGKINMKSLAQKLGVTTGTVTVTVDRLEKKDYARREPAKEDRRVNLISLTDKGVKAFEEHHQFHLHLTEQMLSVISEEETTLMLTILKKINTEIF